MAEEYRDPTKYGLPEDFDPAWLDEEDRRIYNEADYPPHTPQEPFSVAEYEMRELDRAAAMLYERLSDAAKVANMPNAQPSAELRDALTTDIKMIREAIDELEASISEEYGLNTWQQRVVKPMNEILGVENDPNYR